MTVHEPYADFGGRIGRTVPESEPWWQERNRPTADAPNIVVILADDLGYSDLGCYGSEIATPHLDRLAWEGTQFTDFHVTPMCSPTRAALLTGRNPHSAGVGYITNSDPGFPAQRMELGPDVDTLAERLGEAGYSTFAVGKWHLCKDTDIVPGGDRRSWPVQRGFDRFYGFLGGFTDMFQPGELIVDNSHVIAPHQDDDYYFTDDITERALTMVRDSVAADPNRPFFLYFAHGAVHAPLQAPADKIAEHRGAYDDGWDVIRERRRQRQIELGVIAPDTQLPPRNFEAGLDVPAWEGLTAEQKAMYARHMEVYAAMVTTLDDSVGQLRAELEALGQWDNTLLVFLSDNGASREGQESGTSQYLEAIQASDPQDARRRFERDQSLADKMGGPQTMPHYPRGWTMASNTPFRLYKINTHAGGHTVPAIFSWPPRFSDADGGLRHQYAYVTDLFPTLIEAAGLPAGHPEGTKPLAGESLVPTIADPGHEHPHDEQYYEMLGNRGYYRRGWEIVTAHQSKEPFDDTEWELYDRTSDRTQITNLAAERPDLLRELIGAWEATAWANEVFPLDDRRWFERQATGRPPGPQLDHARILPGTGWCHPHLGRILTASGHFTYRVEFDWQAPDAGTLLAHGGQAGGYAVLVEDGRVIHLHNGYGTLTETHLGEVNPGANALTITVEPHDGTWTLHATLNDRPSTTRTGLAPIIGLAPHDGISAGADRGSPVCWERRQTHGTHPYPGRINLLTLSRTKGEH